MFPFMVMFETFPAFGVFPHKVIAKQQSSASIKALTVKITVARLQFSWLLYKSTHSTQIILLIAHY